MSDLKPCPFCGGEAEMERRGTARASMIVACTNCGCRVESGDVYGLTEPERWKWNRREREADELREALVDVKDNFFLTPQEAYLPIGEPQNRIIKMLTKINTALNTDPKKS